MAVEERRGSAVLSRTRSRAARNRGEPGRRNSFVRFYCVAETCCVGSASHVTLYQPRNISSKDWSPQWTIFFGLGLAGLSDELSQLPDSTAHAPVGIFFGLAST